MLYCLVINVHSRCLSVLCVSNSFILSCVANFVNNFFQLFSILFSLFQRRLLKLISVFVDLLLPCSATLDTIHPALDKSQHYFSNFFQNGTLTKTHNFVSCFCAFCIFLFHKIFFHINLIIFSRILQGPYQINNITDPIFLIYTYIT